MAKLTKNKHGVYEIRYYDSMAGYTKRKSTGFRHHKPAKKFFDNWEMEKAAGDQKIDRPFPEIADAYLAYYEKQDPTGYRRLSYRVNLFQEAFGSEVTTQDIENFKTSRDVGTRTLWNDISALKTILRFGERMGMIKKAPYVLMPPKEKKLSHGERDEVHFMSTNEIKKICYTTPRGWIWQFLIFTGIRPPKEIMSLTWDNVKFKKSFISVALAKSKPRPVPMANRVKELLEYRKRYCVPAKKTDRLIPFAHEGTLGKWWASDCKKIGLTGYRLYDCRHTCGSLLLDNGATIPEVARVLGHSIEMCMKIYAHVYPEKLHSAIALLDQDTKLDFIT